MKYGFNDTKWKKEMYEAGYTAFTHAVEMFNIEGFQGMMKRKTITECDKKALKALKEMIEMIETKEYKEAQASLFFYPVALVW